MTKNLLRAAGHMFSPAKMGLALVLLASLAGALGAQQVLFGNDGKSGGESRDYCTPERQCCPEKEAGPSGPITGGESNQSAGPSGPITGVPSSSNSGSQESKMENPGSEHAGEGFADCYLKFIRVINRRFRRFWVENPDPQMVVIDGTEVLDPSWIRVGLLPMPGAGVVIWPPLHTDPCDSPYALRNGCSTQDVDVTNPITGVTETLEDVCICSPAQVGGADPQDIAPMNQFVYPGGGGGSMVFASERSPAQMWVSTPIGSPTQTVEVRHSDGTIASYRKTASTFRDIEQNRVGEWWELAWTRDAFDNQTTYTYGTYGELQRVDYPDGLVEKWNYKPSWVSGWSNCTAIEVTYEDSSAATVVPGFAMVFADVVEGGETHRYFDGKMIAYIAQPAPKVDDAASGQLFDVATSQDVREITEFVYGTGANEHDVVAVKKRWYAGSGYPSATQVAALSSETTLETVYETGTGRVSQHTVAPASLGLITQYRYDEFVATYDLATTPPLSTVTIEGPDHNKEIREFDPVTGRVYKTIVDPGPNGKPRQAEGQFGSIAFSPEPDRMAVAFLFDDTCVCQKPIVVLSGPVDGAGDFIGTARSVSYTYDPSTKALLTETVVNPSTEAAGPATLTTTYEYVDWQGAWGPTWIKKVTRGDNFVVDYEYPNMMPRLNTAHGNMKGQVRTIYRSVTIQDSETSTGAADVAELVTFNIDGNPGLGSVPYSGPASKFPRGQVRLVDDADGVTTGFLYSSTDGSPTSVYRSGGSLALVQTSFAHDLWGRLTGYTLNVGSSAESVWAVTQDARLRTLSQACTTIANVESRFCYDKWGHLAVAEHKNRSSAGQSPARYGAGSSSAREWVRSEYLWRYSWLDEVRQDRRPLDEGSGSPFGGTNPLMAVTSYSFSGGELTVTAPSGSETVLTFDGYGTLFKKVVRDGTASGPAALEVSRSYPNEFLEPIYIVNGSPSLGAGHARVTTISRDGVSGAVLSVTEPSLPSGSLPPGYSASASTGGAVHAFELDRLGRAWEHRVSVGNDNLMVVRRHQDQLGRTRLVERVSSAPAATSWAYTSYESGKLSRVSKTQRVDGPAAYYFYDGLGHVAEISDASVAGDTDANRSSYTYVAGTDLVDIVNRSLANPGGGSTTYSTKAFYDALGRATLIREGYGSSILRDHQRSYNSLGGVDGYTDPAGQKQWFLGDALGRAVEHARVGDSSDSILNSAVYVDTGLASSQTRVDRIDDLGHVTASHYDFAGRMFLEQRPGADFGSIPSPGSSEAHTTLLAYDDLSQVVDRYDGDGGDTRFYYDALGRLIQRELVGIQESISTFNTRDVIERDALGRIRDSKMFGSTNGSAPNGQGADHASPFAEEVEDYDGLGRATQTQFGVYFVQNIMSVASAYSGVDGFRSSLSIDDHLGAGLKQSLDLTFTPDALRRVSGIDWDRDPSGSSPQPLVDYTWRGGFPVTRAVGYGVSSPVQIGTTSYTYDAIGRTTAIEDVVDDAVSPGTPQVTNRFDYEFDVANNLKKEIYGKVSGAAGDRFTYDAYHRLQGAYMGVSSSWMSAGDPTSFDSANVNKLEAFTLDGAQNRETVAVKQGSSTTTFDYDLENASNGFEPSNRYYVANNAKLEYDARGNLTFDGLFYYRYDFLNRLQEVWRIITEESTAQQASTTETTEESRYAPIESVEALDNSRKAVLDDVYQLLHRVPREHKNATFRERLRTPIPGGVLKLSAPGQQGTGGGGKVGFLLPANLELVALYGYDIYNRRTMRVVIGEGTYLSTYDGWAEVCEHSLNFGNFTSEPVKQYVRGNGLDEILGYRKRVGSPGSYSWEDYFIQHGGQDTPSRLLDSSGTVVERYEYDAYGKATIYQESTLTAIAWSASKGLPFLWKGVRFDPETGNHYMRNRYYSAATGRFLSQDPIGVWGDRFNGGNAYCYVDCRPGVWGDAMGLQATMYEVMLDVQIENQMREAAPAPRDPEPIPPRLLGALQALGGLVEAGAGVVCAVATEGLGAGIGYVAWVHGTDNLVTGLSNLWTGGSKDTLTSEAMQAAGLDRQDASRVDALLGMGLGTYSAVKVATLRPPCPTVAGVTGVTVKDSKWDYFFGRVKSSPHNEARSLQNLKDLEALGIREAQGGREQLVKLFEEGLSLPEVGRHVTEHGVTITRTVKVGEAGAIDVKYFYPGGDMTAIPEISTIIPKTF